MKLHLMNILQLYQVDLTYGAVCRNVQPGKVERDRGLLHFSLSIMLGTFSWSAQRKTWTVVWGELGELELELATNIGNLVSSWKGDWCSNNWDLVFRPNLKRDHSNSVRQEFWLQLSSEEIMICLLAN